MMAQQIKRLVLVLVVVFSIAGCGDTTQEIPMLDGSVIVKPYLVEDFPGFPMGYYGFYFRDLGTYVITVEASGREFLKLKHRVTQDADSKMHYYGNIDLSRVVATITVTNPKKKSAQIKYDMGRRKYDREPDRF